MTAHPLAILSFESNSTRGHLAEEPALISAVREQVGRADMSSIADLVRRAMVEEALEREDGNITRAAELLGITRQAVQQLIRRFELVAWQRQLRSERPSEAPPLHKNDPAGGRDGTVPLGQLFPLSR